MLWDCGGLAPGAADPAPPGRRANLGDDAMDAAPDLGPLPADAILSRIEELACLVLRRDAARAAAVDARLDDLAARLDARTATAGEAPPWTDDLAGSEGRLAAALAEQGDLLLDGLLAERERSAAAVVALEARLDAHAGVVRGGLRELGGAVRDCLGRVEASLGAAPPSGATDPSLPAALHALRDQLRDVEARLGRLSPAAAGPGARAVPGPLVLIQRVDGAAPDATAASPAVPDEAADKTGPDGAPLTADSPPQTPAITWPAIIADALADPPREGS